MKTLLVVLVILVASLTARADTLAVSATAHFTAPTLDPGFSENFSTSFAFDPSLLATPGSHGTTGVSNMVVSATGSFTGFTYFGEATFGIPGQPPQFLFTGYQFAWDDPNGNQIGVGVPFDLQPIARDISFTTVFCHTNCPPDIGLIDGNSPGSSGSIKVSEVAPVSTPEPSTVALLFIGTGLLLMMHGLFEE